MQQIIRCFIMFAASGLAGCNSSFDVPLIFGKVDSLGLHAAATAPDQGASASLGFRSAKVAIVPVIARSASGDITVLTESRKGSNTGAFSTFAHFEASANSLPNAKACLGDTFATGLAAQEVAQNLKAVCQ